MLIPQNQITAARASQPWDEALNLSGEGIEKTAPVSTSADRSICEPQDRSLRCASAAAGPEAWASLQKNARWDRSVRSWAFTVHALLPNRQHKECVYPHPLDNAGRDEHTS